MRNNIGLFVVPALTISLAASCGEPFAAFTSTGRVDGGTVDGGEADSGNGAGGSGSTATSSSSANSSGSGGSGGWAPDCPHSPCIAGAPLNPNCDSFVNKICTSSGPDSANAQCCKVHWTELCASQWYHYHNDMPNPCGVNDHACAHSPCVVGDPLDGTFYSSCSQLVADLCKDPKFSYCCSATWDTACVDQVQAICTWSDTACTCL
jgi:hypothetical protein